MVDVEKLKEAGIVSIRDYLMELAKTQRVARTESGSPSFPIAPVAQNKIHEALALGHTRYTPSTGVEPLKVAICQKLKRENDIDAEIDNVIVTSGAMNALYTTFGAMKSLYKDFTVLIPSPFWTETKVNVETNGGKVVTYTYDELGDFDFSKIGQDDLITRKLGISEFNKKPNVAVLVNSPHNPTGDVLCKVDISYLTAMTKHWGMKLISDEAYEHIIYDGWAHFSPQGDHVVNIYSCSKSYGMAGLRVGYIHTKQKDLYRAINKEVRCTINGVNSISQYGAQAVLENGVKDYIKTCVDAYDYRRSMFFDALHKSPYFQIDKMPQGAFYLWAKILAEKTDWEMTALLLEHGVGSAPSDVFTVNQKDYYLRFSYACSDEEIDFACNVIQNLKL